MSLVKIALVLTASTLLTGCINFFPTGVGGGGGRSYPTPSGPVVFPNQALELNSETMAIQDGSWQIHYPPTWKVVGQSNEAISVSPNVNSFDALVTIRRVGTVSGSKADWQRTTLGSDWETSYRMESVEGEDLYLPVWETHEQTRLSGSIWKVINGAVYKADYSLNNLLDAQPTVLQIESIARSIQRLR